jgi:chaperonin GroES
MKLEPLGDRVVIKPITIKEEKQGKIIIPETAEEEKSKQGRVIATGKGKKVSQLGLKVGNRVLFKEYGPTEIKLAEEDYLVADYDDILAKIK